MMVLIFSEKDIDEVLQTHTIFTNVSKGVAAKKSELKQCFNTTDEEKIVAEVHLISSLSRF